MVSADGDRASVNHYAFVVHDEVGGSGADVGETDSELALVGLENGVGAGEGFEHGVIDVNAGAVRRGHDVLGSRGACGDDVNSDFDFLAHQSGGIVYAG